MRAKWVLLALALLGVATYQPLTRGYIFSNIGTLFTWSGSAQAGWSGSSQVATCADFFTFIKNDGTTCPNGSATLLDSYAVAHAVNSVTHSPILANFTFMGGNFASWTSANTGGCNGYPFTGYNTTDEDGDGGEAFGSSGACTSGMTITLNQSFSIGGAPTSQAYSFWYKALTANYGDGINCTAGTGTASLVFKLNGTTITTVTPTLDGAWHQVSGTTAALVNGANTVTIAATLAGATGQQSRYNPKIQIYTCLPAKTVAQTMAIDKVVLSAVW